MKIGDRIFVRGYIDEIRKDTVIVRNDGGYFGTVPSEVITGELPSAQPDPLTEEEKRLLKKLRSYHSGSYAKILDKLVASAQPEIIRCKDCKYKPYTSDKYDYDNGDCGFEIIFPDYRCPCRCEDEYYNRIPDDDWFCGNAERRTDEDK